MMMLVKKYDTPYDDIIQYFIFFLYINININININVYYNKINNGRKSWI